MDKEWISVKDKLPSEDTLCVVSCDVAGIHLARYDPTRRSQHWVPVYGGCCFSSILWGLQYITHWIPIPEQIKETHFQSHCF